MQPIKPSKNVGNKIIFENEKIILWDFEIAIGEETELHTHEKSYIWYTTQGSTLQVLDRNRENCGVLELPTGGIVSLNVKDDVIEITSEIGNGAKLPATHLAKNIGNSVYREILLEFK
ncbi:hypothetical protein F895_03025 [Acinetobacter sp. CIP 64.2]|uniref:hypothetical protein n=1 Tax=Acinetobacter TaxID=469 RepID=UPI0002898871|nr:MULTISPECIES: hypothetical protein [Acinetobacter]ENX12648.1 hypothetical protein F895_03025 [Acinetobacter sp. CIP 64.2]